MKELQAKARELLKNHSEEFVISKLIKEKQGRQTATSIIKAVKSNIK